MKKTLLTLTLLLTFANAEWSDSITDAYDVTKEKSQEFYNSAKQKLEPTQLIQEEIKEKHTIIKILTNDDSVISESQTLFNKITKIQMPNIVPFENKKIKNKYQEITGKLLIKKN